MCSRNVILYFLHHKTEMEIEQAVISLSFSVYSVAVSLVKGALKMQVWGTLLHADEQRLTWPHCFPGEVFFFLLYGYTQDDLFWSVPVLTNTELNHGSMSLSSSVVENAPVNTSKATSAFMAPSSGKHILLKQIQRHKHIFIFYIFKNKSQSGMEWERGSHTGNQLPIPWFKCYNLNALVLWMTHRLLV